MKTSRILTIAAFAVTVLSSCTNTSNKNTARGDLAFFDLKGDVMTMTNDQGEFFFDEDGLLTFEGMKDTVDYEGNRCIISDDDIAMETSLAKPFSRTYDQKGRLTQIYPHYEGMQGITYGKDGAVSEIEWFEEGYSGKSSFEYTDGIVTLIYHHDFGFDEENDEVSSSDVVAFDVDTKGNWTRRFIIVRDSEGRVKSHRIEAREIHYYSGDAQMDTKRSRLLLTRDSGPLKAIIGFKDMAPQKGGFNALMYYKNQIWGISDLEYSFPSVKMSAHRLDGKGHCDIKGEFTADPLGSASVTFNGNINDRLYMNGEPIIGPEIPFILER